MPFVALPSGISKFHYIITTPTSPSSLNIDTNYPTILFIHGEYVAQTTFEAQFSDPLLRNRFNLIGVDLRGYGETAALAYEGYTPADAATDLYDFLNILKISATHIFAVSIGCHVAIELALTHPGCVSSLTLCTMPPAHEPPEILAGRQEVFDYWNDSGSHEGGSMDVEETELDDELVKTLVSGIQSMLFGEDHDPLADALIGYGLSLAKYIWAGSPETLTNAHVTLIKWFANRRIFDVPTLSKLKCPITVIHCREDIAYMFHDSEEFVAQLQDANLKADLHQVVGPHFGHVTNADAVNPILCERVLSVSGQKTPIRVTESKPRSLDTPFKANLAEYGYRADEE